MSSIRRKFLSVPDFFEAKDVPSGSSVPSGIISRLLSETSDITSYVEPSSKHDSKAGDINTLVNWDSFSLASGQDAYFQIKFKHGYVYSIAYSLKGDNNNYCFAKEWYLYGFNEVNGAKTLLSENKSEGSTFCSTGAGCNNGNWGTFSVYPVQQAFKYIRIVCKTSSCTSANWLFLSGIEVFGVYSIDGRTSVKVKENNQRVTCIPVSKFTFYSLLRFTIYIS